eukprot:4187722-Prymnesium_polylepis.1
MASTGLAGATGGDSAAAGAAYPETGLRVGPRLWAERGVELSEAGGLRVTWRPNPHNLQPLRAHP